MTVYLLSVFLSIGATVATFAVWKSGRSNTVVHSYKGFEKTSEANWTNLIGNLSVPATFFEFKDFKIFSTSSEVTKILGKKSLSEKPHSNAIPFHFYLPIEIEFRNYIYNTFQ